jgi:hypothetical protein
MLILAKGGGPPLDDDWAYLAIVAVLTLALVLREVRSALRSARRRPSE